MEPQRLIEILKTVPETKLSILSIVWEVIDDGGFLDLNKCLDRELDINMALAEADMYVQKTDKALAGLFKLLRGDR